MTTIIAQHNNIFKRKHDGVLFGNEIVLGLDFSTGVERQDLVEYYEEIRNPELPIPPTLMPFAIIIPEVYQWVFDNGVFALNGYEVPLDTNGNDKVVNMAYFMWQEFRNELDKKDNNNRFIHETLKNSFMPLWDYVKLHGDTIGPWMQDPQNNALSDKVVIL